MTKAFILFGPKKYYYYCMTSYYLGISFILVYPGTDSKKYDLEHSSYKDRVWLLTCFLKDD
jgi:hypothetical protein